jgi:hypothetical protein
MGVCKTKDFRGYDPLGRKERKAHTIVKAKEEEEDTNADTIPADMPQPSLLSELSSPHLSCPQVDYNKYHIGGLAFTILS